jgi:hypothetical protein
MPALRRVASRRVAFGSYSFQGFRAGLLIDSCTMGFPNGSGRQIDKVLSVRDVGVLPRRVSKHSPMRES